MIDNLYERITGEKATTGMFLKDARKQANLTQTEVSEATGIKVSSVSKYENDKMEMGATVALRFAALYKMSPITLLYPNGIKAKMEYIEVAERIASQGVTMDNNKSAAKFFKLPPNHGGKKRR